MSELISQPLYTNEFLYNLKIGDELEGGIVQCIMSGYHHYKLMKLLYSDGFVDMITKKYEEKYNNWLDETFIVLEIEMIRPEENDESKVYNKHVVIALSELPKNQDRVALDLIALDQKND